MGFLNEMLYQAIFVPNGHPKPPKSIINEPSLSKYISNWNKDEFDICLVTEAESELVGAVWGRKFVENNKGFGFIGQDTPELGIAVKPDFRGKGIGLALMQEIFNIYRTMNVKSLSVSVDKLNKAIGLYEKTGFEPFSETEKTVVLFKELGDNKNFNASHLPYLR